MSAPADPAAPPPTADAPKAPGPARRLAVPAGVLAATVAAFAYVGTVDPNEPGHYPACPLLTYAGIWCPGCGGLRSAHAVWHGELATALTANALAVAGYALFAAGWLVWAVCAARGRPFRLAFGRVHAWAAGVVLLSFGVARNLPQGSWLHP
ncbi:DUF2752 domain-containing protein [Streptomyces albidoflavus]|uniref:DUF2752 domain-containing protein n=2 Tax=Streptomyces TaxID=1883 RepID=UPI00081ECA1D|nr:MULTISPECIES: DUF2752 domain-containing protein [Streptomyces]MYQ73647.1 DUF2752 domain-containing protein [Streptomyces sp. SID4934]MBV7647883.1 DUF2752 domain-containing protein [Streptomyces albidoflavus]MBV7709342.1 DUF2752 domain-containing protein [Streptomyces albidoflavus]MCU7706038.1 DUF2752 domain-containing protein [Streptomyces albidoflavus]RZD75479.1 DUF2752 domain-containing protein [Streptomyces albidoflavus]